MRRSITAALLLLAMAACGSDDDGDLDIVATYENTGSGGMDARLSGELANENG